MKDELVSYQTPCVVLNGGTQAVYHRTGWTRQFTFSGFGPGDGIVPTPGQYVKQFERLPHGRRSQTGGLDDVYATGNLSEGDVGQSARNALKGQLSASYAVEQCIQKLYAKIRDSQANIAVDVGEAHELKGIVSALKRPVKTLLSGLRLAAHELSNQAYGGEGRRARRRGTRNQRTNSRARFAQKAVVGGYLGTKYGIAPAVAEINNLLNYKITPACKDPHHVRVRHTVSDSGTETDGYYDWERSNSFVRTARCEIAVVFSISNPDLFDLSRLTTFNPVSLVYELTTLSFVLDWFLNVGGFLSALEASLGLGLSYHHGYMTVTQRTTCVNTFTCDYLNGVQRELGFATGSYVRTDKVRTKLTDWPTPPLPTFHNPLSFGSQKILSGGALLRSRFKI